MFQQNVRKSDGVSDLFASMKETFKYDFVSSTVVFLVAIPLCLGIAVASKAPIISGIIAGIIGGIIIGSLSKSHVSVSGPAAGLVAVVLAGIHDLGSFNAFLLAVTFAGLIQVTIGKFKAGFIADYIPSNVIQGLLCAIGIVIIIKEIPLAIGYISEQNMLNELREAQEDVDISAFMGVFNNITWGSIVISFTSLVLLFSWGKIKNSTLKLIPGPVIVVLLGIALNLLFETVVPLLHLSGSQHLVVIPEIANFKSLASTLSYPDWGALANYKVYVYALIIAIVATLETLLNLEAAEKIDSQKRYCDRNKEMVAQGIGNTISGLVGGLPITSVIVRSSVNVTSGAKTKASTIMHGFWLVIAVLFLPKLINQIPMASLAAILIYSGFKLAHYKIFQGMYNKGLEHFLPFITTVVMIVASNLLTGVLCGLAVSAFMVMKYNSRPDFKKQLEVYPNGDVLRIMLPQQATFLNKAALISALTHLPANSQVILDASQTHYIDYDIKEVIEDFTTNLSREKNISLTTRGFQDHYEHELREDFTNVTTAHVQQRLKPQQVLTILQEGNKRFLNNTPLNRDLPKQVAVTAQAQHPLAVVLSCVDSRVPVEMIFDMGVGDLFATRVVGNVVNDDVIASLEYACAISGAKLIVVMGHTACGAIKAACDDHHQDKLSKISDKIRPAIDKAVKNNPELEINSEAYLEAITSENVKLAKQYLMWGSKTLSALIKNKEVAIVGAMYDVNTGVVNFDQIPEVTEEGLKLETKKVKSTISAELLPFNKPMNS